MEEIIVDNKYRTVIYDTDKKIYKKYVRPKIRERIEIFFGMKKAHGKNAYKLSEFLRKNGIKAYEVLSYTKYSYVTKEVNGKTLLEKVAELKNDKKLIEKYINKYMETVKKIIDLNLYYCDFYFNNLMVDEEDNICIIDIDEMEDTWYCRIFKNKKVIPRLRHTLAIENDRLKGLGIDINLPGFFEKYFN